MGGDRSGNRWSSAEYLLALIADRVEVARVEARVIAGDKKPPAFTPLERPGASARAKADEAEAAARVELLRRKPKGGSGG